MIKSVAFDYYYKGHCADLTIRLQEHNTGKTSSIRKYIPFVLVYFEQFETRLEAVAREKYFKTGAGRRFLKTKLKDKES
ncbi:GIY-YIG nuclease family protein [Niabella hibiscisoli]|uniref:GIY-YIG nuclease family protein n=1 Tax=Niabella hibiscisoli TaxID=1825928 RepID=UPI001F0D7DEF|nr:GIY-YIG nuclease family protein [Niabella hibiscisoli]MCH5717020.1 GIY-YIG nuclease family protein [Niabella hibiscisoli]